jgi:hypothetical protein
MWKAPDNAADIQLPTALNPKFTNFETMIRQPHPTGTRFPAGVLGPCFASFPSAFFCLSVGRW